MFIVQISLYIQGHNNFYHPPAQVLEPTLSQSHPLGENAAEYSAVVAIHTAPVSFHQVPITAGWLEAVWIESLPKALTRT